MDCQHLTLPGGTSAIVCGPARRRPLCSACKKRRATRSCDGPGAAAGATCDAPLCDGCAYKAGALDYCRAHRPGPSAGERRAPASARDARPVAGRLYALTLYGVWAYAVAHLGKDLENRDWPPPPELHGRYLAIHAGATWDDEGEAGLRARGYEVPPPDRRVAGAIVAVARVDGYVTASDSRWWVGPYGWRLADVRAIEPVACRGLPKLWHPPRDVVDVVRRRWLEAKPAPAAEASSEGAQLVASRRVWAKGSSRVEGGPQRHAVVYRQLQVTTLVPCSKCGLTKDAGDAYHSPRYPRGERADCIRCRAALKVDCGDDVIPCQACFGGAP